MVLYAEDLRISLGRLSKIYKNDSNMKIDAQWVFAYDCGTKEE